MQIYERWATGDTECREGCAGIESFVERRGPGLAGVVVVGDELCRAMSGSSGRTELEVAVLERGRTAAQQDD